MINSAITRLLGREDFRRRPVRALGRRLFWRLRWLSTSQLWQLPLPNGLSVFAPNGGAGALIYYQGCSEPETTNFLQRFLTPGMVFFDIGAHIGEYALFASMRVGPSGSVHAFEPQPDTFEILGKNIEHNRLTNVTSRCSAVAELDGYSDFAVRSEPSLSSMLPDVPNSSGSGMTQKIVVPKCKLDTYCSQTGCSPRLIKVDVEGAEVNVLEGARMLLSKPPLEAPVWILEYSPETYRRFAHSYTEVIGLLERHGYELYSLNSNGSAVPIIPAEHRWDYSQNLVAAKAAVNLN